MPAVWPRKTPRPAWSRAQPVALLVLLARPARARRVAGNLVAGGLRRNARVGRATATPTTAVAARERHPLGPGPGRFVLTNQLHPVDVPDELVLDGVLHLLEHAERLALVFD